MWQVGTAANGVVALAYLGIAWAIVRPLVAQGQIRANPLGAATAAIFFTCAVHHGSHSVHMLLPALGLEMRSGLAMRESYDWTMASWDVVTSVVGIYYWTLRRTYGPLMRGAQLFEDMRAREHQALELNDGVLQGLVVAKMALELDETERARAALDSAIASASRLISDLLVPGGLPAQATEHDLTRSSPAVLDESP